MNRRNKLNDLSAHAQIEREHPAPFSFTDVARLVRLFTKRGMTVLGPRFGVAAEWLRDLVVSHFSAPGALVVVPFAGSGTECLSALRHGRSYWGAEIKSEYVRLARTRLQAAAQEPGH